MNTFVKAFNEESTITYTENGCRTFSSSLDANVDFFGMASAKRNDVEGAVKLFMKAWKEDKQVALRNLFYLRDIRGGQGERQIFRSCLYELLTNNLIPYNVFTHICAWIPEYGRWDDLFFVYEVTLNKNQEDFSSFITHFIDNTLVSDMTNKKAGYNISLLAKWFPLTNNTKKDSKRYIAKKLRDSLGFTEAGMRKVIVDLRRYLDVLEQKLTANEWQSVDYSKVPSCANKKYSKAFMSHDSERYSKFIEDVNSGNTKMHSATLYPYEIVCKMFSEPNPNPRKPTEWDAMWKSLPDYTNGSSAVCVVDTSGSMGYLEYEENPRPIHAALSLGLYFAERNKGAFKDIFFTFSSKPNAVKVEEGTLYEKFANMSSADWGMNTDIYRLFDLYIQLAEKSKPEDCPKNLIIISDMEFDQADKNNERAMDAIYKKFADRGISIPKLIFWNVASRHNNVPVRADESGTVLCSGLSPSTFKFISEGTTPYEFMTNVLNSKRYQNIRI